MQVAEAGKGIAHESEEFERARAEVRARLEQIAASAQGTAREVIAAHLEFLDDWELVAAARRAIARGKSAGFAWRRAVRDSADTLRALGDPRMSERVDDLLDLESQVLLALNGEAPIVVRDLPERAILIAEDLKPSQLVSLDATPARRHLPGGRRADFARRDSRGGDGHPGAGGARSRRAG